MTRSIHFLWVFQSIVLDRLWRPFPASLAYALAICMALGMALHLYPVQFLLGHGQFFEGGDAAQHVSGWLFFQQDSWRFPLLKTEQLNYPEGISIAFTDSIPLMALPMKLISAWLPEGFHYFGIWHAISYLLQAIGAVFLIRALGILHLPGAFLAIAFALTWPALTFRLGHTALMSQGLLLISLGVYLRGCSTSQGIATQTCLRLTLLSAIALLIHPYFLAMIYPVLLAYLAKQWHEQVFRVKQVISWLAGSLAPLFMILFLGGYFLGKGIASGGYDIYSLNLLAPFCGSSLCNFMDGTGGQSEGFNYFGAGFLFLFFIALLLSPKAFVSVIFRHRFLFLVLLLLTLYALSNRVYLGKFELIHVDLPGWAKPLTGIFRVSGRFFWLVGYCALFFVLAVLLRRRSPVALLLVMLALTAQWYDTRGLRDVVMMQTHRADTIDLSTWAVVLEGVDQLDLYPIYGCESTSTDDYVHFQHIAARLGLRINTGYTARHNAECTLKSRFITEPTQPGHLYIRPGFGSNPLNIPSLYQAAIHAGDCVMEGKHLLCLPGMEKERWASLAVPLSANEISTRQDWAADQLPSVIGHIKNERLIPRQPGMSGYLSYGPYISLPTGIYQFRIDYLSDAQPDVPVGHWDVVGRDTHGRFQTFASGPLIGTNGKPQHITETFSLSQITTDIELRLFTTGEDAQLSSIAISNGLDGLSAKNNLKVGTQ